MSVSLVPITPAAFRALESGDLEAAERLVGLPVPDEFWAPVEIWRFMLVLAAERPDNTAWLMNAVVADGGIVGNAGFKGAPAGGEVELGYRISPSHRRRGHAASAVSLLLDRARRERHVDRVIARIDPANIASIGVVTAAGFVADGEHTSPRSGRQLQFVRHTPVPSR
jgi:RimJ/RimL family protein N-acetyltransferase